MKKRTVILITIVCILVSVAALFIWQRNTSSQENNTSTTDCVDNRDKVIENLGGPERAANMGVSSTLEGCND